MADSQSESGNLRRARLRMVRYQLETRGIHDSRVLSAMRRIPRERFVPQHVRDRAYEDTPLPIGEEQTISQPYMVAWMTQLLRLRGEETVLEIGTGSGYQTAVLAETSGRVFSVERFPSLSSTAQTVLDSLCYPNVRLRTGDGSVGWEEYAPYDRIIITAAAPLIPQELVRQLGAGGIMVVPVGDRWQQMLKVVRRTGDALQVEDGGGCIFVPLIGQDGWRDAG